MTQHSAATSVSVIDVGMTPTELQDAVAGPVWVRWSGVEPGLRTVSTLAELDRLRGAACDPALGALVRLAARDGGDEELAAVAVVHQLNGGVRRLCARLRDLSDDIDAVVVGELWRQIRTFPWQRRTRAYAANLLLDTRSAVLRELQPDRGRDGHLRVIPVEGGSTRLDALLSAAPVFNGDGPRPTDSERELADLVGWACACNTISRDDVQLLVDLLVAGHQLDHRPDARSSRGVSSELAVARVAQQRGVCSKTVVRHRNRVLEALRGAAQRYLTEVA